MKTMDNHEDIDTTTGHVPSPWISALPLIALVLLLGTSIALFGSDSLAGPSQVALLCSTAVCILLGMLCCGVRWNDIEGAIESKVRSTAVSVYILLIIGCLSAIWMVSGIVPTLICYGIDIIHPSVFLASACIISGIISLVTGSSWTTIATIGIALLGIGRALGFSDGWTAGAIISGAYFGDKISPLSDTTVLASSSCGTPLFKHIRYMLLTTVPSLSVALMIFVVAGLFMGSNNATDTSVYTSALHHTFNITPWLLLVPVLTGFLIYKRMPSLIVLFLSTVMAVIMALLFQSDQVLQIAHNHGADGTSWTAYFHGVITIMTTSTGIETGVPLLNDLVSTSGMAGMLNTIWLILCAMCFGGAMTACGMLSSVLNAVFRRMVRTRTGLVTASVLNGISMNLMTGDQYISIILTSSMFRDEYEHQGYESRLLSRTAEDSATVTSVLIPWNTCGMTQATVLGVPTLTYMPFCFFNIISPLMSIIHAAIGWRIYQHKKSNK